MGHFVHGSDSECVTCREQTIFDETYHVGRDSAIEVSPDKALAGIPGTLQVAGPTSHRERHASLIGSFDVARNPRAMQPCR